MEAGATADGRARRTDWRGRRTGRRAETRRAGEAVSVVPTTPVWLAIGAFTEAPSGKLLGGCGIWLDEFELVEVWGAFAEGLPCAQAASAAASSRADNVLKRDIAVTF